MPKYMGNNNNHKNEKENIQQEKEAKRKRIRSSELWSRNIPKLCKINFDGNNKKFATRKM